MLLGVTGSGKTFTMAKVIEATQRPALILAPNKTLAAQLPVASIISRSKRVRCSSRCASSSRPMRDNSSMRWRSSSLMPAIACNKVGRGVT